MWDNILKMVAIIAVTLIITQFPSCLDRIEESSRAKREREAAEAQNHWFGYVEPRYKLCLEKGGWPRVIPPHSARQSWEHEVLCDFPAGGAK